MTQDSVTSFVSKPTTPKSISTRRPSRTSLKTTTTREPQTTSVKSISSSQLPRTQSSSSSENLKKKITTFHPLQERVTLKNLLTLKKSEIVTQNPNDQVTWSSR